ncbi:MAG: hypothetical protein LBG80_11710, partial [Bacteroidales bacterium]|nr:hypothetical protein [Bacteroidales bacterium]
RGRKSSGGMDAACYNEFGAKDFCYNNLPTNLGGIAHNVPAVYDVLPARIRALRSKDQGWQNVG